MQRKIGNIQKHDIWRQMSASWPHVLGFSVGFGDDRRHQQRQVEQDSPVLAFRAHESGVDGRNSFVPRYPIRHLGGFRYEEVVGDAGDSGVFEYALNLVQPMGEMLGALRKSLEGSGEVEGAVVVVTAVMPTVGNVRLVDKVVALVRGGVLAMVVCDELRTMVLFRRQRVNARDGRVHVRLPVMRMMEMVRVVMHGSAGEPVEQAQTAGDVRRQGGIGVLVRLTAELRQSSVCRRVMPQRGVLPGRVAKEDVSQRLLERIHPLAERSVGAGHEARELLAHKVEEGAR